MGIRPTVRDEHLSFYNRRHVDTIGVLGGPPFRSRSSSVGRLEKRRLAEQKVLPKGTSLEPSSSSLAQKRGNAGKNCGFLAPDHPRLDALGKGGQPRMNLQGKCYEKMPVRSQAQAYQRQIEAKLLNFGTFLAPDHPRWTP